LLFFIFSRELQLLMVYGERDDRCLLTIHPAEMKSRSLYNFLLVM